MSLLTPKLTWGYARRHWFETLLCVLGVALGVAVAVAIEGAVTASVASFQGAVRALSTGSTHAIEPISAPSAGSSSPESRAVAGLTDRDFISLRLAHPDLDLAPIIDRRVFLQRDTVRLPARLIGIDALLYKSPGLPDSQEPSPVHIDLSQPNLERFVTQPGTVLLSPDLAASISTSQGLLLSSGVGFHPITPIGTPTLQGPFRSQLQDIVLADIATAQELAGMVGRLDRIDVRLPPPSATTPDPATALAASLPPHLRLRSLDERAGKLESLIAAYRLNLLALSLMASFVAVFIVYNALLVSLYRRTSTLAVLRCLGATRSQLASIYLLEALLIALLGSAAGLLLGYALSHLLVAQVSLTINDLYARIAPPDVTLSPTMIARGLAVGLVSGFLGAALPLYRATLTPPITLLRPSTAHAAGKRTTLALAAAGGLCLVLAFAANFVATDSILAAFAMALLTALGFAGLCPAFTLLLASALAKLARARQHLPLQLAGRAVLSSGGVTGIAVAATMLAMAMDISLATMVGSFRSGVLSWVERRYRADLFIAPTLFADYRIESELDPAVEAYARTQLAQGKVQDLFTYRRFTIDLSPAAGGPPVTPGLLATELSETLSKNLLQLRHAPLSVPFDPAKHIAVSEPLAGKLKLKVADTLKLPLPGNPTFTVYAIYFDFASEQGELTIERDTYRALTGDPHITSLNVRLPPGADVSSALRQWSSDLSVRYPVVVNTLGDIKQQTTTIFNRTFRVTDVLAYIAGAVAFCGLVGALLALAITRQRQHALLGAVGMTPGQGAIWIFAESVLLAVAAASVAWVAGTALAYILAYVIQYRSFGWSIPMAPNPGLFLPNLARALLAAAFATLLPILHLRTQPLAPTLRQT